MSIRERTGTVTAYTLATDNGGAPNVENNLLSQGLCKAKIREKSKIGDLIVMIGGKPLHTVKDWDEIKNGFMNKQIICLFIVTEKKTWKQYATQYPSRMDAIYTPDLKLKSDAIYHNCGGDFKNDLGGKYVLLSENFIFFGDKHISLPPTQKEITPGRQYLTTSNGKLKSSAKRIESAAFKLFYKLKEQYGSGKIGRHISSPKKKSKC